MSDTESMLQDNSLIGTLVRIAASDNDAKMSAMPRTHHEAIPIAKIRFVPEENYRWESEEGMRLELAKVSHKADDGRAVTSYENLRESIRSIGVQDPVGLVLRDDGYHIIFGFTRVHAAMETKRESVPAYVYEADISESDIELMQVRENSAALRRAVNWVAETERYTSLWGALYMQLKAQAEKMDGAIDASLRSKAKLTVCRVLGRNPSRLRSAEHFLRVLDRRVINLARLGHIDYAAAQEFHSGDVDHPFPPAKITAFLKHLHGRDGYAPNITSAAVRAAKNHVNLQLDRGADSSSDADVGDEPEERSVARGASSAPLARDTRAAEKAAGRTGSPGPVTLMKGAEKIRTSSAMLRDLSDLVAWEAIKDAKLTITSPSNSAERLVGGHAWLKICGIGWGADTVTMPPLMEVLLGGRDPEDSDVERMQMQHERSQERYVISAFVRAFLRAAAAAIGTRNIDFDDKGWITGKSPSAAGETVHHRAIWTSAIQDAVAMPGKVMLLDRAKEAWKRVSPHFKAKK